MNGRRQNWLKKGAHFHFFSRSDVPRSSSLHVVLDLALVAALAFAAAHWTWVLAAPAAVAASSYAAPAPLAEEDAARLRALFGASAGPAPAASGALRLVGIAAGPPEAARAVFALGGGKSKAARAGETIVPGTILREVHADHVLVERNGVRERLALERRSAGRDGGR